MRNKQIFISFFFFVTILSISIQFSIGQNIINSPYSRLGFGETSTFSTHPYNSSMGGISQGIRNNNMLNPSNPASFSAIRSGSFVFDMGFYGEVSKLSTSQHQGNTEGIANISHISFGFPIVEKYKMSFGLMPYSNVEYYSSLTKEHPSPIGNVKETFEGTGGINKVYWGHGVQVTNNLSLGANVNLLFGKIREVYVKNFLDTNYTQDAVVEKIINVAGLTGSLGAQYQIPIKENHLITLGLTYDLPVKYKVKVKDTRYGYSSSSLDTSFHDEYKESVRMPQAFSGGITYERRDKWLIGLDVIYTDWSKFMFLNESSDSRKNNISAALGGEIKGNLSAISYWNRISWRGGVHFENAKYYIDGNNIDDMGVHIGISFPMRKVSSVINMSFLYGVLGKTDNNLIKKDYFKIGISFSTGDRWFMRRKFD